jgi:hypothetical protein
LYPHSEQDREKSRFGLPLNHGVILEHPISALGQSIGENKAKLSTEVRALDNEPFANYWTVSMYVEFAPVAGCRRDHEGI